MSGVHRTPTRRQACIAARFAARERRSSIPCTLHQLQGSRELVGLVETEEPADRSHWQARGAPGAASNGKGREQEGEEKRRAEETPEPRRARAHFRGLSRSPHLAVNLNGDPIMRCNLRAAPRVAEVRADATAGDLQEAAGLAYREGLPILLDEAEPHVCSSAK
jgi:hypothetical protein